jgi:Domain of unknown function (DUF5606)
MLLREILSVPGMNGLYKIIGTNKSGFIVESLQDGKRTMVSANQRIMNLSDIAVFTKDGELPLRDVFKKAQEMSGGKALVDPKSDQQKLRDQFKQLVPGYDEERVYMSDIKKIFTWFELLNGKIDFSKEESEAEEADNIVTPGQEHEKTFSKHHEMHGPKTEHAKSTSAKTRKKV